MLALLCSLGLATCTPYYTPRPPVVTIERFEAPGPFTTDNIAVIHHRHVQRVDVCYPPSVPHLYAPCFNDGRGDGGGSTGGDSSGGSSSGNGGSNGSY